MVNFSYWNMYDFNNDMNLWERIADTLWTLSWYNDYADERRHSEWNYTRNTYDKKHKKTLEEKAAVAKQKKQQMRAKLKKETRDNLAKEEILQDDRFFVIAGYTSGGAPYGITWEEMGLKPWDDLENKMV